MKILRKVKSHANKIFAYLSLFSMLANTLAPLAAVVPSRVYAEDTSASEEEIVVENKEGSASGEEADTEETADGQDPTVEEDKNEDEKTKEDDAKASDTGENKLEENGNEIENENSGEDEDVVDPEAPDIIEGGGVSDYRPIADIEDDETVEVDEIPTPLEGVATESSGTEPTTVPSDTEPITTIEISETEPSPVVEEPIVAENSAPSENIEPETPAVKVEEKEYEYLKDGAEVKDSVKEDWNVDGEVAKTIKKVELGVKYIFPLDEEVSVTFTKLPKLEEDRDYLKIERVKVDDLNLPDDFKTNAEYAFDITTFNEDRDKPMENEKDFEYEMTLPKPEGEEVEIVYIEKDLEKAKEEVSKEEIKEVKVKDVEQEDGDEKVKIEDLDHFTIFVVVDDGDTNFSAPGWSSHPSGYQGDHMYVTSSQTDKTATWKYSGDPITNGAIFLSWTIWSDHATNAIYKSSLFSDVKINQKLNAGQTTADTNGTWSGWYRVPGKFTISNGSTLTLSPTSSTDGNLSADAVAFVDLEEVPNKVWVDDNYSYNNSGEHFWGYDAFNKIQDGINAVASGGTVYVTSGTYCGTYYGQINLNKPNTTLECQGNPTICGPIAFGANNTKISGSYTIGGETESNNSVPSKPTGLTAKFQYDSTNITNGSTLNITAKPNGNNLELLWANPNPIDLVTGYRIFATYPDGTTDLSYQGPNTNAWLKDYNGFGAHGNGKYTYQVIAVNANGTSELSDPFVIYYDTHTPTATFTSALSNNSYINGNFDVEGVAHDNVALKSVFFDVRSENGSIWITGCKSGTINLVYSNDRKDADISCTIDTRNLVNGTRYMFRIHAGDYAGYGNVNQEAIRYFTFDNEKPTTPTNGSPNNSIIHTNEFDFTWDASTDVSTITYEFQSSLNPSKVDGVLTTGLWKSETLPNNMIHSSGASGGTWYWQVRAKDAAGNYSNWSDIWTVTIDTKAPSVSDIEITKDGNPVTYVKNGDKITISATITDNLSGIKAVTADFSYDGTYNNRPIPRNTQMALKSGEVNIYETIFTIPSTWNESDLYITVAALDNAGNYNGNRINAKKLTIDNTPPTVSLTSPIDNYFTNQTVVQQTWDTNATDVAYYQYRSCRNNPTNEECTVIYQENNLSGKTRKVHNNNIAFWWQVRGIDKAGNIGEWSTPRKITIDNTKPSQPVIINSPNNSFSKTNWINIVWTEGDDQGTTPSGIKGYILRYEFNPANGGNVKTWSTGLKEVGNPKAHSGSYGHGEGRYTIYVKTIDNAGNESPESEPYTITYDNTSPTTTITTPRENTSWGGPIDIKGYSADDNGIDSVSLEYAPYNSEAGTCGAYATIITALKTFDYNSANDEYNWSYEKWTPTTEGSYCIKAYATDKAGNVEQTAEIKNVIYDITIPEITLTTDPTDPDGSNDWFKTKPTITLTATDSFDIDRVEYQWGSKIGSWTAYTSPFKPDSEGKLVLYYRSIDKAGNESVGVKNIKVDTDKPSSVSNVEATYNENENSITLDWDVEDSDIEEVRVYKGKSSDFDTDSLNRISKQSADDENYTDKGDLDISISRGNTYYYKLVAIDSAGNRSNTKKVSIEIPEEGGTPVVAVEEGVVEGVGAGEEEEGQVAGEETGPEGEGVVEGTEGEEGSVLGEETAKVSGGQSIFKSFWFWLILVVLGVLIIWLINKKSENGTKTKKKYM